MSSRFWTARFPILPYVNVATNGSKQESLTNWLKRHWLAMTASSNSISPRPASTGRYTRRPAAAKGQAKVQLTEQNSVTSGLLELTATAFLLPGASLVPTATTADCSHQHL